MRNIKFIAFVAGLFCWVIPQTIFSQNTSLEKQPQMQMSKELQKKLDDYINADSQKTMGMLSSMPTEELMILFENFKAQKSLQEKRMLKIAEEYLAREADRVASDRLIYLTFAGIALMILFFAFIGYIFNNQKKIAQDLNRKAQESSHHL